VTLHLPSLRVVEVTCRITLAGFVPMLSVMAGERMLLAGLGVRVGRVSASQPSTLDSALVIPGWSSRSPSVHADTSRSKTDEVSALADSMIAANLK
jgi:hypothetical protein